MIFLYLAGTVLMIVLPLALASVLAHRRQADWGLFGIGATTFIASQLFHIPFNMLVERGHLLPTDLRSTANLLALALFLGLSAGIFEEVARYLTYRFWARGARRWRAGLMLGAGHGGFEALILGLLALINVLAIFGMGAGHFTSLVPLEQLPLVQAQAQALQDAAWYDTLLAPAERVFALAAHLSLSLLVLEGFIRRRQGLWLGLAIGWHALFDALAVFSVYRWNVYAAEGAVALLAVLSVGIIVALRRPALPETLAPDLPREALSPEALPRPVAPLTAEKLEQSRFQ